MNKASQSAAAIPYLEQYWVNPVSGGVQGAQPASTSMFSDQDMADLGLTRDQLGNILTATRNGRLIFGSIHYKEGI